MSTAGEITEITIIVIIREQKERSKKKERLDSKTHWGLNPDVLFLSQAGSFRPNLTRCFAEKVITPEQSIDNRG
jgi:hypothetical protein